ncbi:class I SAM-dependent methyltransferase [Reichenbachiella sp.]|uniref:class I SAM-dependent methyltransferase n=1 Tax=Reichenbachiella sp. TaxID=2184521 RepID=UPI003BAF1C94
MQKYHKKCLITDTEDLVSLKKFPKTELVKSKSSGLVFTRKIPTEKELSDHYNNYSRSSAISEITIKRYHDLLDQFESYRTNNKILEVGCGGGAFLVEAKKRGWEVYGTEYTKEASEIPQKKGITVNYGKLNPDNYPIKDFDIIVSIEVIEHINNPLEEASNIYSLLRSGGLFYVTTPNFNAIERYYLGEAYKVIGYPEHLIYFTPKTLHYLMKKVGFEKEKLLTTGINISSFKGKKQRQMEGRQGGVKNSDQNLRQNIENHFSLRLLKTIVNKILTLLQIGNAMKGYYIKP